MGFSDHDERAPRVPTWARIALVSLVVACAFAFVAAGAVVVARRVAGSLDAFSHVTDASPSRSVAFDDAIEQQISVADPSLCPSPSRVEVRDPRYYFDPWYTAVRWNVSSQADAESIVNGCLGVAPALTATTRTDLPCDRRASIGGCWQTFAGFVRPEDAFDGVRSDVPILYLSQQTDPPHEDYRVVWVSFAAVAGAPTHVDVYLVSV